MNVKYRIHNAPTTHALQQGARIGSNMAIVHSVGPCSTLEFERCERTGRYTDEFPIYFDEYPKVATLRRSADAAWIEPLRRQVRGLCARSLELGMKPAFHFYEPQLPLVFEREYPDVVGMWRRSTQVGAVDVHTRLDPDNPETWKLMKSKYREIAAAFPEVALFIVTTGDIAGTYWGIPDAEMSRVDRLVRQATAAREGIEEAGSDATVCFRLWWRNHPDSFYTDAARMIGESTGLDNALDLMNPVMKPYNQPSKVIPELLAKLPPDMPIMYKSTPMDIHDNVPLTYAAGTYPPEREQILEISYEQYHLKPWPWAKVRHIRTGLDAVKKHGLSGYVSLPINMGNNERDNDPESGNLGRMNTWMFGRLAAGDARSDAELVAAWLEEEFGAPQPPLAVDALLDAEQITDDGLQWGRGIHARDPFGSPHSAKLYWFSEGHVAEGFTERMLNPDRELIDGMIAMKEDAHARAASALEAIVSARAGLEPRLYEELVEGYTMFADSIELTRDWHCYVLAQYGIEKGVYPADRTSLGRMSRYVERFIRNVVRLEETPAGRRVVSMMSFPDVFPLT